MQSVLCTSNDDSVSFTHPTGYPTMGFLVDAADQVVLNLQDEVQQTWKPGDRIIVASTDYSMHQAEEFTLLPCPQCTSRQVRIQGKTEEGSVCFYLFFVFSKKLNKSFVRLYHVDSIALLLYKESTDIASKRSRCNEWLSQNKATEKITLFTASFKCDS